MPVRHDDHSWLLLIWILRSSPFLQRFATLYSGSALSWRSEPSLEELRPSDPSWQSISLDPLSWRTLFPEAEKLPQPHPAWWWWVILPSFGSWAQALGKKKRGRSGGSLRGDTQPPSQEGRSPGQSRIWSHWTPSSFTQRCASEGTEYRW